jgi:hypothetical protein
MVSKRPLQHWRPKRIEDLFGLPHLGYAEARRLAGWGSDVFTNPHG